MITEIMGRMLDNGLNLNQAIKDTVEFRRNKRNLPKNIDKYQSLIGDKIGLYIEEYDLFGDNNIVFSVYFKDKIINYSILEHESDFTNEFIKRVILIDGTEKDSYFVNDIVHYIYRIEQNKIILSNIEKTLINAQVDSLFNKNWIGKYSELANNKKQIIDDLANELV